MSDPLNAHRDTTKAHPLFGGDPSEYFYGKAWRKDIPMAGGPRGEWVRFSSLSPNEFLWIGEDD